MDNQIGAIYEEAKAYISNKVNHLRLEAIEKTSDATASMLSWTVILTLVSVSFIVLSFTVIFFLANALGGYGYAGLVLLGFYLIILALLIAFRKKLLVSPIKNFLLGEYMQNQEK